MYVELELGWMAHPFPTNSFKISSLKQIDVIKSLGLKQVRCVPAKSDPPEVVDPLAVPVANVAASGLSERESANALLREQRARHAEALNAQSRGLAICERRFGEAIRQYKQVVQQSVTQPHVVAEQCLTLVTGFASEMLADGESAIRLLSEGMGDRASMHPVNVTIVSLLLGKAMNMPKEELIDLGMAAFLHDVGKTKLPDRVRWLEENFSTAEYKLYQDHVVQSVELGKNMGLSRGALLAIAQHHELIDGSGFPAKLKGDKLTLPAKILALINRYENLCNPGRASAAMTPHEALSLIFSQLKTRFDSAVLSAFIRMMGVYPPGSVVQLVDERYAMVVAVNSARPLKPRVFVHDRSIARHEALILDLESTPNVGIRRSVKPASLPRESLEYLSPRQRVGYFFEKVSGPMPLEAMA